MRWRPSWPSAVFRVLSGLVMGGAPIGVPLGGDDPLDSLQQYDFKRFTSECAPHDWDTLEGFKEAVDDLLKWCTAAAKHGYGLVSIGG